MKNPVTEKDKGKGVAEHPNAWWDGTAWIGPHGVVRYIETGTRPIRGGSSAGDREYTAGSDRAIGSDPSYRDHRSLGFRIARTEKGG